MRYAPILITAVAAAGFTGFAHAQYRLERIAPVLNQPTHITQAPGDPSNVLFYSTRITSANNGNNSVVNTMGKIFRYDVVTRTSTVVLDLSSRQVAGDNSLSAMAFHPDYNIVGSAGFGKMYVASSTYGGSGASPLNRLEVFSLLNADGTMKNSAQVFSSASVVLEYPSDPVNWHLIDWIGFDPNAAGAERAYLYMTTGDGRVSGTAQNPSDLRGKVLRIDVDGPDSYPANALKNFAIPANNPLPVWNANNPGAPITGLGEVFATGLRNPHRASFDRANSNFYIGDVGEGTREEVDFIKAGSNTGANVPFDFGWSKREGTTGSGGTTNTFTGALSLNPIREYTHTAANGFAIIGGYVYRGPIPELQGKYLYGDFVTGRIWALDFDPNTNPSTFNGANGTINQMTTLFNSLAVDTWDPSYVGDSVVTTVPGFDHLSSFGEDNAGNLYILDFSAGSGQGYWVNTGEMFRLTLAPGIRQWTVDGGGTWAPNANWSPASPITVGDAASFLGGITAAAATITLDGNQIAGSLTFGNSSASYTIAQGVANGSLYLNNGTAPAAVTVLLGDHQIIAPVVLQGIPSVPNSTSVTVAAGSNLTISGGITGTNATLTVNGPGDLHLSAANVLNAFNINTNGRVHLSGAAATRVNNLTVAHTGVGPAAIYTGQLDVGDGRLIVQASSAGEKAAKIAALAEAILSGETGGWTGQGITSATAAANADDHGVGLFDNAIHALTTYGGQPVNANSVIVTVAHLGDTNFDGIVDINDLGNLANGWQQSKNTWSQGDLNLDGFVDINDLGILASHWQHVDEPILASQAAAVPEPASLGLLALAVPFLIRRRSKVRH